MIQAKLWEETARQLVAHVDMDAFFASVEQLDDPQVLGKPLIVANSPYTIERVRELVQQARGSPGQEFIRGVRGVVASASYEARAFGVRSAMPLARAMALCPEAIVVPGRFERYREIAERLRAVWAEFSPVVEPVSLDEAYLDLTGSELSLGSPRVIGEKLKSRIREETRLAASVGIASNKLMAKIASDLEKPDGLVIVARGAEAGVLAPLPVRALPGIGPRSAEALRSLGITTVGQLAAAPLDRVKLLFGADHAIQLLRRAVGFDDTPVEVPGDPKSVSREITLADDTCDVGYLRERLRGLCDEVAWTLREDGLEARCVYIKLRLLPARGARRPGESGFGRLITRRFTLPAATIAAQEVFLVAGQLLDKVARESGITKGKQVVRLLGVGTSSLQRSAHSSSGLQAASKGGAEGPAVLQSPSASMQRERLARVNSSVDIIRERYGFGSIAIGANSNSSEIGAKELMGD